MNIVLTGATGMVGEGVLHECLNHPKITKVTIINRRPSEVQHPKLREILHSNLQDLTPILPQLENIQACFFCAGVTSIGKKEPEYTQLTYDLTLGFVKSLATKFPDLIVTYVSGQATDSSEKGKVMWARVKGRTENQLLQLPVRAAFMFRPGFMKPTQGLKRTLGFAKVLNPLYKPLKLLFPNSVCTLAEVGQAMINCALVGAPMPILEVKDIVKQAHRFDE